MPKSKVKLTRGQEKQFQAVRANFYLAKAIASRLAGTPLKWYRCENATRAMSEKDMFTIVRAW